MPSDHSQRPMPADPDPFDDIEILEVVGVDEDGVPVPDEEVSEDDVEVVFEEAPEVEDAVAPAAVVEAEPDGELREIRERLIRLQADFENFKKRVERERLDHLRYATSDLLGRFLPVLDNFERALASVRPGGSIDAFVEGVELIHRQLLSVLEREGLREMESVGQAFDPGVHEAVATERDPALPSHVVTHVFQRGYFLHDRLLRPAMVRVRIDEDGDGAAPDDRKES